MARRQSRRDDALGNDEDTTRGVDIERNVEDERRGGRQKRPAVDMERGRSTWRRAVQRVDGPGVGQRRKRRGDAGEITASNSENREGSGSKGDDFRRRTTNFWIHVLRTQGRTIRKRST